MDEMSMDENKEVNTTQENETRSFTENDSIWENAKKEPVEDIPEAQPFGFGETEEKKDFSEPKTKGSAEFFSEYVPPQPVYYEMPRSKNKALRILGIIAAALVIVMLFSLVGASLILPKPSFEIDEDQESPEFSSIPKASDMASEAPLISTLPQPTRKNNITGQMPSFGGIAPEITNPYNPVIEIAAHNMEKVVSVQADVYKEENGREVLDARIKGTGFVVSADGYIITNYHVVAEGTHITVRFTDESEYIAEYVGGDETIDIALLKINAANLPVVALGDSDTVPVGEFAIAIGNPSGMGDELSNTLTVGYVSAVNREIRFNGYKQEFLQIDTAINPGNSGGPVFNSEGEVIGIVTLKSLVSSYDEYGSAVDSEGVGFAIPINTALGALEEIFEHGAIRRPGIGIFYTFYDEETAELYEETAGMHVGEVTVGGPSEKAGLMVGDIIIRCDGMDIVTGEELVNLVKTKGIGSSIELVVLREGVEMTFIVEIVDLNK